MAIRNAAMATNEALNLMSTTYDETNKENASPQPSSSSTPTAVAAGNLETHPGTITVMTRLLCTQLPTKR